MSRQPKAADLASRNTSEDPGQENPATSTDGAGTQAGDDSQSGEDSQPGEDAGATEDVTNAETPAEEPAASEAATDQVQPGMDGPHEDPAAPVDSAPQDPDQPQSGGAAEAAPTPEQTLAGEPAPQQALAGEVRRYAADGEASGGFNLPDALALIAIGDQRYGLYLFKDGYSTDDGAPTHSVETIQHLEAAGLVYLDPTGGNDGSVKITPDGREALPGMRALRDLREGELNQVEEVA